MSGFERLGARERLALDLEDAHAHRHAATACVLELGPLAREGGGVDIDRIRAFVESRLYRVPLCRKRVVRTPLDGTPVWVDDEAFSLQYHVRHTHLPVPGDERLLKRLCGRLASQRLDPERPLWELWVVEGLEGDRCALVAKAHECVSNGRFGLGLLEALLSPTLEKSFERGPAWLPRPRPSARELIVASLGRRLALPLELGRGVLRVARDPERFAGAWERTLAALRAPGPVSESPFNQPIGPHRRIDWLPLDARSAERIAARFEAAPEAVLLATIAGAVGCFLEQRGLPFPLQRDLQLRVALSERSDGWSEEGGTVLAFTLAHLPSAERDPVARLRAASAALADATRPSLELLTAAGAVAPGVVGAFARRQQAQRRANLTFSPLEGPLAPLHLLGARVHAMMPLLPLPAGQALRIAALPYAGALQLGFSADWDLVPDLHDLVLASAESFHELAALACEGAASPHAP